MNAALSEPAGGSGALTHLEVSALLHAMLSEQMAKRQASVLRLLRIPSLRPAIEALQAGLAAEGRALGGRKEKGCTAKEGLARLRALCAREMGKKNGQGEDDEEGLMWLALSHVLRPSAQGEELGEEEGEEGEGEGEGQPNAPTGGRLDEGKGEAEAEAEARFARRVRKELKLLLGKLAGCEQLKPSQPRLLTTHVGNWGIRGAVRALREGHFDGSDPRLSTLIARQQQEEGRRKLLLKQDSGLSDEISLAQPAIDGPVAEPPSLSSLTVSTLTSLRVSGMPTPMLTIRKSDGNTEVEACWVGLKAAFAKEASALIIHHKNHYSLIFAMREWRSPDGIAIREVLTARKGQRPTAWVSWKEIHCTLASWSGYAIMQIHHASSRA